jgi:ABC-2 type transport system permease protein
MDLIMVKAILYFSWAECKLLFRAKATWVLLLVASLLGVLALNQGKQIYTFRTIAADSVQAQQERQRRAVQTLMEAADTTAEKQRIEEPYYLDFRLAPFAIKRPEALSAWAVGQSDIYPAIVSLRFNQPFFSPTQQEFSNPLQLLAGNFDVAYYLLFLFPLLFLALIYAIPGEDIEQGIYQWQRIYYRPILRLYALRIAVRWVVATLPFHLCLWVGSTWILPAPMASLLSFWSISVLYQLFWLLVAWAVLAFRLRTATQAVVLVSIWLVLLFLIPALPQTMDARQTDFSTNLATTKFRTASESIWQQPLTLHRAFLATRYSSSQIARLPTDSNQVKYLSWGLQMMSTEGDLFKQVSLQRENAAATEMQRLWYNPIAAFYQALTRVAQTDMQSQLDFETAVFQFRDNKAVRLFEQEAFQPRFRLADFQQLPIWQWKPTSRLTTSTWMPIVSWLLVLGIIVILLHTLPQLQKRTDGNV